MNILEATVEIAKATLSTTENNLTVLTSEPVRKDFLVGIEALYEKLHALDAKYLKK